MLVFNNIFIRIRDQSCTLETLSLSYNYNYNNLAFCPKQVGVG
jgi:hypothetical protein